MLQPQVTAELEREDRVQERGEGADAQLAAGIQALVLGAGVAPPGADPFRRGRAQVTLQLLGQVVGGEGSGERAVDLELVAIALLLDVAPLLDFPARGQNT